MSAAAVDDGMEKWLVSLLLQEERVRDFTLGRLSRDDFQNAEYGNLFQILTDLPRDTVWEVPILADRLGYTKDSEAAQRLTELRNHSYGGFFNCKESAKVVDDAVERILAASKKRFIHYACTDLANLAQSPTTDLATIEAELSEMQKKVAAGQVRKNWKEHTTDWIAMIEQRYEHRHEGRNIGTGLPSIDSIIGRFNSGHLIVIKARFKVGKSAFVLGILNHATVENKAPGLIISLEMSRVEWMDRLFAHRTGVDSERIISGNLLEADFPKIVHQVPIVQSAPLYCEERDCYTPAQILSLIRFYKITADIQYVILDHANLVQFPGSKLQNHENLGALTGTLKGAAKQLAVTIFCLCQTNEDGTTFGSKTMIPANLDKDIHITVPGDKRPDETNIRHVNVELNRHGRTGGVKAFFDGPTLTFRELSNEQEPDGTSKNGHKNGKRRYPNDE